MRTYFFGISIYCICSFIGWFFPLAHEHKQVRECKINGIINTSSFAPKYVSVALGTRMDTSPHRRLKSIADSTMTFGLTQHVIYSKILAQSEFWVYLWRVRSYCGISLDAFVSWRFYVDFLTAALWSSRCRIIWLRASGMLCW